MGVMVPNKMARFFAVTTVHIKQECTYEYTVQLAENGSEI